MDLGYLSCAVGFPTTKYFRISLSVLFWLLKVKTHLGGVDMH